MDKVYCFQGNSQHGRSNLCRRWTVKGSKVGSGMYVCLLSLVLTRGGYPMCEKRKKKEKPPFAPLSLSIARAKEEKTNCASP